MSRARTKFKVGEEVLNGTNYVFKILNINNDFIDIVFTRFLDGRKDVLNYIGRQFVNQFPGNFKKIQKLQFENFPPEWK